MGETPLVTVVTTVYNDESRLRDAIRSIRTQSLPDIEHVIVDDGSEDDSLRVARTEAESDDRIRVIDAGRVGRGAALQIGVREARGKWLANLDSDDVALPTRLALQVAAFERDERTVLVGGAAIVDRGDSVRYLARSRRHGVLRWKLALGYPFVHSAVMYRVATLRSVGGFREDLPCCLDYDVATRLATAGRLMNLACPVVILRKHSGRFFERYANDVYPRTKAEIMRRYRRQFLTARRQGITNV